MNPINTDDYFDLGSWETWNFMNWQTSTINQTALNNYLDSYAKQAQGMGLKQVTFSFAQVCDISKLASGDFSHCSLTDSFEMVAKNTAGQTIEGKSFLQYAVERLHQDGMNVYLSFGGSSASRTDWNFGFNSTNPTALAQKLADWVQSMGFSGLDFDMEDGAESMIGDNGAGNLAAFFYNLRNDLEKNGMPLTLSVQGDASLWGIQGTYFGPMFSQGYNFSQMFDGLNLMLYNGQYYLNAGQQPPQSWDLINWVDQMKANTGLSAAECVSLMHIGFDSALDYSKRSSSGGPLPYDPSKIPSGVKTNGQYAAYILSQLQDQLRDHYNDPSISFGSSFFWDDKANYTVQGDGTCHFFDNNTFEKDFNAYTKKARRSKA